ncbi:MAG: hypothetical protein MUC29_08210 [Pyrinomonadaceae bacterium]|jgi:hypothetical protein|nr:hypothetical protein [Pyrinomonadaceae bacterium]
MKVKPTKVLLVEGKDDLNVIGHIFLNQNIEVVTKDRTWKVENKIDSIFIQDQEGVNKIKDDLDEDFFEQLLEDFKTELKQSELQILGIIVDANGNAQSRWESLANRLKDLNYEDVPKKANPKGTILLKNKDKLPPIGIWIMPNNSDSGMLEDFVGFLIPNEQQNLWNLAEKAVSSIPEDERRFSKKPDHSSKAKIHTYLAWQKRPGIPFGIAIREKFLDVNAQNANDLMKWLKELFDIK